MKGPGHIYLEAAQKAREERRKIKEQRLRKKLRKAKKKVSTYIHILYIDLISRYY